MKMIFVHTIFKDETGVSVLPVGNSANLTDFDTNRKSDAIKIMETPEQSNMLSTELSYVDFTAKITGNITNVDIKYVEKDRTYTLYLFEKDDVKHIVQLAVANLATVTLWTPAAGKKIVFKSYNIGCTSSGRLVFKKSGTSFMGVNVVANQQHKDEWEDGIVLGVDETLEILNNTGGVITLNTTVSGVEE